MTLAIYRVSVTFPKDEVYGLTSQLRRACTSIPANIAEGCGRGSRADLARFLQIAAGSASEVEYYLILARDLTLLSNDDSIPLMDDLAQVKRMLAALIRRLRAQEKITTANRHSPAPGNVNPRSTPDA